MSVLPICITLGLAVYKRNIIIALISGIIAADIILDLETHKLFSGIKSLVGIFENQTTIYLILFLILIGAFVNVIEKSGGIHGLVILFTEKHKIVKSPIIAELFTFFLGILLFIDGTSSIVISGISSKNFFDKHEISRRKLAYILDSTSAPIAWLSPITGAGAFLTMIVSSQIEQGVISGDAFSYVLKAVPYQLYSWVSIGIVAFVILSRYEGGFENLVINKVTAKPIKTITKITKNNYEEIKTSDDITKYEKFEANKYKPISMILPVIFFVVSTFALMYIDGNGNILQGNGMECIYISIILTLLMTAILYKIMGISKLETYLKWSIEGIKNYTEIVIIFVLALGFSSLLSELKSGEFIANYISYMNPVLLPLAVFIIGAIISLSTGTSGGTTAILLPIAISLAANLNVDISLIIGAVVSGAVFGDHCSPLSDSTILAAMVSEIEVMDHVISQLPKSVMGGLISCMLFLVLGVVQKTI